MMGLGVIYFSLHSTLYVLQMYFNKYVSGTHILICINITKELPRNEDSLAQVIRSVRSEAYIFIIIPGDYNVCSPEISSLTPTGCPLIRFNSGTHHLGSAQASVFRAVELTAVGPTSPRAASPRDLRRWPQMGSQGYLDSCPTWLQI